jgi:predicted amidophosphoribosyltransferase
MNCRDCNQPLSDKYIPYTKFVGTLQVLEGICFDCSDKYNTYKHHDGKNRDFCEKCGEKFLSEDLSEVTIKKQKMLVCPRCRD